MTGKHLLASIAILMAVAANSAYAAYNVTEYCQLVKPGTQFPSFDSCQTFYTCQTNGYIVNSCPAGESFDKNAQSCKASSTVSCYYGIDNPCATTSATYIANPEDCNGYIYCKNNKKSGTGLCPTKQIWDATKGACVYGTCTNDEADGLVPVDNMCQIVPNGVYFGDFEQCNGWHICSADGMESDTCHDDLVYNTKRGMCLKNDGTMCSRIENPSLTPTEPCTSDLKDTFKGDVNVCSVYYACNGTTWNKQTCTTGLYYDVVSDKCVARQLATPTVGCNRCQYATTSWVNAVDPTCREYLYCDGNSEAGNGICDVGFYFNEQRQVCLGGSIDEETYSNNNGACYNAGGSDATTEDGSGVDATTEESSDASTEDDASTEADASTEDDASTEADASTEDDE